MPRTNFLSQRRLLQELINGENSQPDSRKRFHDYDCVASRDSRLGVRALNFDGIVYKARIITLKLKSSLCLKHLCDGHLLR